MTSGPTVHTVVPWILGGVLLWAGLRWFERANIYFPSRGLEAHPGTYGLKYEDLTLKASDAEALHAWYVENRPGSPVILFSHGNGGNISHRLDKLLILRRAGASVLLYDYRGYGKSTGRPSEQGTYRDAESAYEWLTQAKLIPPERLVFHGESLGAAVAVEMAARHPCAGLIVESGFTSIVEMGRLIFPFLPVNWIVRFRYDAISKIPEARCPVLVMHSPQDDIIPYAMGRKLFEAAPEPKAFFEMRGDHNEGFLTTGRAYEEAIRSFLERRLKP